MASFITSLNNLFIIIFLIFLVLPSSNDDGKYKMCISTLFSYANNILNVGYPVWGKRRTQYCNYLSFRLQCLTDKIGDTPILKIGQEGFLYNLLNMIFSQLNITFRPQGFGDIPCNSYETGFNEVLEFNPSIENTTLVYRCSRVIVPLPHGSVPCCAAPAKYHSYYLYNMSARKEDVFYSSFEDPVFPKQLDHYNKGETIYLTQHPNPPESQIIQHFDDYHDSITRRRRQRCVRGKPSLAITSDCIKCKKSGGTCGLSENSDFVCLCKNGAFADVCLNQNSVVIKVWELLTFVGSASFAVVIGLVIIMFRCLRKRRSIRKFAVFWKSKASKCPNVDAFLQIYGSFALTRHTYADIKQMTNGFRDKLGEGGFGTVYKGKLLSGRLVAVKVLKQPKADGEDFMNEVATISRTNHVNIVTLLGFCFEGNKRALIYEFLPNGSLEKFMYHGVGVSVSNPSLPWGTLFNIATGIARGLNYLHRGCNARILHFDIKPHNILLDEEFRPKISDFGLARLCPLQESTISMLEARGTIGYIAPEVFCRTIGRVSHKSDVYSFGMMVIDMVCGRKNFSADLQRSSEVYFPEWIYDRLELEEETPFQGTSNGEEQAIQKKMIIVSLWCIQTYPSNRPSMSRVVDMLQGSIESIEMPPKLNLSSPPRSALDTLPLTETSD